jgi:hypothetical protein
MFYRARLTRNSGRKRFDAEARIYPGADPKISWDLTAMASSG